MFNPLDFLVVAQKLSKGNEGEIRTSIGRAYYAAFLNAREWLRTQNWIFYGDATDHAEVEKGLEHHRGRKTKDKMARLRRNYRSKADYDLAKKFSGIDASDAINLAEIVIRQCSS